MLKQLGGLANLPKICAGLKKLSSCWRGMKLFTTKKLIAADPYVSPDLPKSLR